MLPRAGDVLVLDKAASVQFIVDPIFFRVIRKLEGSTYEGWIWLDGYELDKSGDAVARRSVFVQISGLRPAWPGPATPATPAGKNNIPPAGRIVRQPTGNGTERRLGRDPRVPQNR